eukprot:Phypoly_transcript_06518.p1 GENE.Phypoly_transcript_06518~~Phypoly_transcript_06518.p1  ORF type:complete len:309 (+),score=60.31 Phypoly_transcript_06518:763-1689(+)
MQFPKDAGALLQHISSNISKLMEVIEDSQSESENVESWATVPTLPRVTSSNARDVSPPAKDPIDLLPYLKAMSVLLVSITNVVIMLSAALTKLINTRKRALEIEDVDETDDPPKKAKKKGREKKDVLADDGSHIVILTSKQLPESLSDQYFVVNINSTFKRFSTRFPHMHVPIPFMPENRVGSTVEGIWQGLQVYENEDTDGDYMIATKPRDLVRKAKGEFKGWRKGLRGTGLLSLVDARKQILIPTYKHVLEKNLKKEVQQIQEKREREGKVIVVVGEGGEVGWDVEDEKVPFGAAGILKLHLLGNV